MGKWHTDPSKFTHMIKALLPFDPEEEEEEDEKEEKEG